MTAYGSWSGAGISSIWAVAAAAPTAVTPEQGAIWAYPLPEHDLADLGTVLVSALLGRVHLSGRLDLLSPEQAGVVRRALETYKSYRHLLPGTRPGWPLGLPGWRDGWAALALTTRHGSLLLALWRRDGAPETTTVPLPGLAEQADPYVLFTAGPRPQYTWNGRERTLRVTLPAERSALLPAFGPTPLR